MAYTNAIYYIDFEGGSDAARTALTTVTVSNPSGTITRCNKTAHGLTTGAIVVASAFTAWLNAAWKITVVDADNFDLDTAVWQATADASGTITPNGGSSKADAWKTMSSGATAARIAPGDTCRLMGSLDETSIGLGTWTQYSKTITLASAVTANISDCETAWTGAANVTATADTSVFKEGTKAMKAVIAAGFTTGKIAHFPTGTLNLSPYQQVSFWIQATGSIVASNLSLRLCSDVAGVTAVHTIAIPALPFITSGCWAQVGGDVGSNLNSAIASVALYADIDPGAVTIYLDNIIACKASASADSLTHASLIGKVWNKSWAASTTYAANDIRRPTQPNRNGFCYQVTAGGGGAAGATEPTWPQEFGITVVDGALTWTCYDLEDTWWPIQSINGTVVKLDNRVDTAGNAGRGYDGTTETVATYKREPIKLVMQSGSSNTVGQAMDSGTATNFITFSGGWDRTTMAAQTGETWFDGQNGGGYAFGVHSQGSSYIRMDNLNGCRFFYGMLTYNANFLMVRNCHYTACLHGLSFGGVTQPLIVEGMVLCSNGVGIDAGSTETNGRIRNLRISGSTSININSSSNSGNLRFSNVSSKNSGSYGIDWIGYYPLYVHNLISANNVSAGIRCLRVAAYLDNCLLQDATPISGISSFLGVYHYSQKHGQVADAHLITTDGGTIISATDQRHTLSGISWKFRPTSITRHELYPLSLSVTKIACAANTPINIAIWTRRDSTNIVGKLRVVGGQIAGVPLDVTVTCTPAIDGWELSNALSVTPTESGVIEVMFEVYDGVGTANNFWVDDLVIS